MVYRGAFFVAPAGQRPSSGQRARFTRGPRSASCAGRTEGKEGRIERFGGEDGFDLEVLGGVATARKVLEEGIPERLRRRRDVVRGRLRVELVQAELDDAIDELRVQDGRVERDGGRCDRSVLALDDGLHLVCVRTSSYRVSKGYDDPAPQDVRGIERAARKGTVALLDAAAALAVEDTVSVQVIPSQHACRDMTERVCVG